MNFESSENPILYSAGSYMAYTIAKRYYHDRHFVWCTTRFHSPEQPPTSDPQTICNTYLRQIKTGDQHFRQIADNKFGILRGARIKLEDGEITGEQYKEIEAQVSSAYYEMFCPVLYVIPGEKVEHKCEDVPVEEKASDDSIEFVIKELDETEFEVIMFKDVLKDVIKIVEKKAGE